MRLNVLQKKFYNDQWIRILVVPIFTALGYYVTYNFIKFNSEFVLLFLSDLIKGYILWELLRYAVISLDNYFPWEKTPMKRLALQLSIPVLVPLVVFIVLVELEYFFLRKFPRLYPIIKRKIIRTIKNTENNKFTVKREG